MGAYFLGVDTGATKSQALIADETGRILGRGNGGPGNWESVGWAGARQVLGEIIGQALAAAGLSVDQLTAAGFGLAGYDWPEDRPPHEEILAEIGIACPYGLFNDAMLGLYAASPRGWGVVVAAGTSCNCYGRNPQGQLGRMGGASYLFGEYAGASEIVIAAKHAVAKEWSRRGPATALTQVLVEVAGAEDIEDLMAGLARGRYYVNAAAAPQVFAAAEAGDEVAREIIDWAGRSLAELVNGVAQQLDLTGESFDVVLAGSLFHGGERLIRPLRQAVQAISPTVSFYHLSAPPVVGGLLMAMNQVGPIDTTVRDRLVTELSKQIR